MACIAKIGENFLLAKFPHIWYVLVYIQNIILLFYHNNCMALVLFVG